MNNEVAKWITYKGRRLPIGADGRIIKLKQEQVNNLKSMSSWIAYGQEDIITTKYGLSKAKSAQERYRKILKKYKDAVKYKRDSLGQYLDEKQVERLSKQVSDMEEYYNKLKHNTKVEQNKYNKRVQEYKNGVYGQINILDK